MTYGALEPSQIWQLFPSACCTTLVHWTFQHVSCLGLAPQTTWTLCQKERHPSLSAKLKK